MLVVRFFALLACWSGLASVVSALDLTSLQGIPPCGIKCLLQELSHSDCSITNQTCMCNDDVFTGYVETCVVANCTVKEMLVAKNQTMALCGVPLAQHDNLISWIQVILVVFPTLLIITRIVNKCMKISPWGWDDTTIIVAYVVFIVFVPAGFLSEKAGAGKDIWALTPEQITQSIISFFVLTFLYMLGLAFIKASILFLYLRIFPDQKFRRILWYTQVFNLVMYLSFLAGTFAGCQPLNFFWDGWTGEMEGRCFNVNAFGLAHGALNFVLDIWMLLLPASQIYKLNMPLKQKIGVMLMFSVGIFLTTVSGYRIKVLRPFGSSLDTADSFQTSIWSAVELAVGIFVACLPSTRKVWAILLPKLLQITHISSRSSAASDRNSAGSRHTPRTISGSHGRPRAVACDESSISDLVGEEFGKANSNQTDASGARAAPDGGGVKAKMAAHVRRLERQLKPGPKEQHEEYDLQDTK